MAKDKPEPEAFCPYGFSKKQHKNIDEAIEKVKQEALQEQGFATKKQIKLIVKKAKLKMFKLFKEHFPKPEPRALLAYTEDGWNAFEVDFEKDLK